MTEELLALEANQTGVLIPHSVSASIVGSKWIYSIKVKSDRSLDLYKACFIAQGFKQEYGIDYEEIFYGIDYEEIFSLVSKMTVV